MYSDRAPRFINTALECVAKINKPHMQSIKVEVSPYIRLSSSVLKSVQILSQQPSKYSGFIKPALKFCIFIAQPGAVICLWMLCYIRVRKTSWSDARISSWRNADGWLATIVFSAVICKVHAIILDCGGREFHLTPRKLLHSWRGVHTSITT
jgi:hypothetical protein